MPVRHGRSRDVGIIWGCTGREGHLRIRDQRLGNWSSGGMGSDRCGHGGWVVRIVLEGQEDDLSLKVVASCLAGREGCQISVVNGLKSEKSPFALVTLPGVTTWSKEEG